MSNNYSRSKTITKNSIALYVRLFALMLIGFYTARITLEVLGVEDFGIYNLVCGIILMANFISNSLALSTDRYLAYNIGIGDTTRLRQTFSMSINIHLIIVFIIVLIGETFGLWFINTQLEIPENRMNAVNIIYQASIFSFIFQILGAPYNSDIIAHEKMEVFAYISILYGITKLIIALTLPFFPYDKLVIYALLMSIPSILFFFSSFIYTYKYYKETHYTFYWSKLLFIEMSKFAGFSTFGNMATAIVSQGQNILLNIFFGPIMNAARGLSVQVNNTLSSFINGVYTAVNPQIVKSYAQNDTSYFENLIYYSTLAGYYMLFVISLPLLLEMDFLLGIWLKEVPPYTSIFIQLLIINSLIYNFVTPSWMALQATGKVARIHLVTGSINLLNLLITYLLWKGCDLPPYSIFIINIIISLFMQIATVIIQKQQLSIKISTYILKVVRPALVASSLSIILPLYLASLLSDGAIRFFIILPTSIINSMICIYYGGMNREMRLHFLKFSKEGISSFRRLLGN